MNRKKKINIAVQTFIVIGILLFVNLIGNRYFKRIDLTEDERFSVSEATVSMLDSLDGGVLVTVYFAGEMPTKYQYLQDGIRTFLIELSNYSSGNLNFQFTDPGDDKDIFNHFMSKGLQPFRLVEIKGASSVDKFVLPYAEVSYKGGEPRIVNLVKGCVYNNAEERKPDINVERALQNLEYNLVSTIYALTRPRTATVGILSGHGEYPKEMMADLYPELNEFYNIVDVNLDKNRNLAPDELAVLMVMQPDSALNEREKFELDQYVMRGGKIIFFMDHEIVDFKMDEQASTLTTLRNTNLDDLFMKWGVVLNYEIVEDLRSGYMDVATQSTGQGSAISAKQWTFHPLVFPKGTHPTVRNVSDVLIRFGASIDTFIVDGISKKVLLASSPYTKRRSRVQYINIDQHVARKPDESTYRDGQLVFGITVGGNLRSMYEGRPIPADSFSQGATSPFVAMTRTPGNEQIAIIGDGEFANGEINAGKMYPLPSDNKTMVMNLVDYFTGNEVLTSVRVRKMVARNLNAKAYEGKETTIQAINIILPLLIVIGYGFLRQYLRTRKNRSYQKMIR
jgi:ABC-2 type transport system permease protein